MDVPLQVLPPSLFLHRDDSLSGYGTPLLNLMALGVWSQEESLLHFIVLEMWMVMLVLAAFLTQLSRQSMILMSDNATVVVYLRNRGHCLAGVVPHGQRDRLVDRAPFCCPFHSGAACSGLPQTEKDYVIMLHQRGSPAAGALYPLAPYVNSGQDQDPALGHSGLLPPPQSCI